MYVGPMGNLQVVADPEQHLQVPRQRAKAVHELLAGGRGIDQTIETLRTWHPEWEVMTEAEFNVLALLQEGMYGSWPYAFIDPGQVNFLTANQSSAGDALKSLAGFSNAGGTLTLGSTAANVLQGSNYIQYLSPAAGGIGSCGVYLGVGGAPSLATLATPNNSVPCVPTMNYDFFLSIKSIAGTAASWRASVQFFNAAGGLISQTDGAASVATGSYVVREVKGAAPALSAFMVPLLTNGAVLVATNTLAIDQIQLSLLDQTTDPWSIGLGVPFIGPFDITDDYPWLGYHKVSTDWLEVA